MGKIRVAIVGVGNCASALLQGIEWYKAGARERGEAGLGLMHYELGGYEPGDIEVVCAFDIDARKVGKPLAQACFAPPNNAVVVWRNLPDYKVRVDMGEVRDGIAPHMANYPEERRFVAADAPPADIERRLKQSGAEVMLCYLPVGSQKAAERYAQACLSTGASLLNCMPAFIVSDKKWAEAFTARGIPIVGDDVKSQLGATIVHRALVKLFADRGVRIDRTYQLNTGGNTDFLNMLDRSRLRSKLTSKTEAVQSVLPEPLPAAHVHIGPCDYVAWQNDNKICFLRIEGSGFAGVPLELELRMSVQDSANSAGMVIDAVRCLALARQRGLSGPLYSVAAYAMKHPPRQLPDDVARARVEQFIRGEIES